MVVWWLGCCVAARHRNETGESGTEMNHLQAHVVDFLHELDYSNIARTTHQDLMVDGGHHLAL